MRINNNNSLDLAASRSERLKLSYRSGDAVVTFTGPAGSGALHTGESHDFVVPATGMDVPLVVRATFKGTSGGTAVIQVSDMNGTVAPFTFVQFPNSATDAVAFLIDIE